MKKKSYISIIIYILLHTTLNSSEFQLLKKKLFFYTKNNQINNCKYEFVNNVNIKKIGSCRININNDNIKIHLLHEHTTEDSILIYPVQTDKIQIYIKYHEFKIERKYTLNKDELISTTDMFIYYYSESSKRDNKFVQLYFYKNKFIISIEYGNINILI